MWKLLLISVVLVAFAFVAIAIKMFLQKGGQFTKSCSSADPSTGEKIGCVCGDGKSESCAYYEQHHGVLKQN